MVAQETIETRLIKTDSIDADNLISTTPFGAIFYISNNIFYKKQNNKTINYNNLQLGNIKNASTFNPLKINLFYNDFNTLIILDNRLSEIYKIDFNTLKNYKNVSHVSTGYDNTVWIFNEDNQKLELFDYKSKSSRAQTQPIESEILDLKSNYNYCWLLTKKHLLTYNYLGNLTRKTDNNGYTNLDVSNENIVLKKDDNLYYINKNKPQVKVIQLPNLIINQFFVTNETLYIYNQKVLQEFQLITN